MHIICPHCTTSYAIELATLGAAGRTVRCSRCKEVWLARPEDATELKPAVPAMAEADGPAAQADSGWDDPAYRNDGQQDAPVVDSPSISADWPVLADGEGAAQGSETEWPQIARDEVHDVEAQRPQRASWFRKLLKPRVRLRTPGK